jgi:hypothetical protein
MAGSVQTTKFASVSLLGLQLLDGIRVRLEPAMQLHEPRLELSQEFTTPCNFREK